MISLGSQALKGSWFSAVNADKRQCGPKGRSGSDVGPTVLEGPVSSCRVAGRRHLDSSSWNASGRERVSVSVLDARATRDHLQRYCPSLFRLRSARNLIPHPWRSLPTASRARRYMAQRFRSPCEWSTAPIDARAVCNVVQHRTLVQMDKSPLIPQLWTVRGSGSARTSPQSFKHRLLFAHRLCLVLINTCCALVLLCRLTNSTKIQKHLIPHF